MKVLANWLNDYLSTKVDARTAADRLEQAGIEVEQIISSNKLDKRIVVVQVKKVIQHPNADRLKLVDVDTGDGLVRVVCGAPNVAEGQKVALAQVGTILPDGIEIKAAKIRGEESNGMLCSAMELGISDDHTGIMVLEPSYQIGTTLCDIWDSGEILDLSTAANRFDLQSVVGLAREIAAQNGEAAKEVKGESRNTKVEESLVGKTDKKLVARYVLAHVKLGKTGESPMWMRQRLVASGVRPINSVVDITNYVMLEVGQPLHAFDAANIKLPVSVRSPHIGEKLTTLDGINRQLTSEDLIIADTEGPVALAGVMGGLTSQIIDETNEILLEAASFDGPTVRKMAARHGLRTDASSRFERSIPLPLVDLGLRRALELLREHCDAEVVAASSQELVSERINNVEGSLSRMSRLLGMEISRIEAVKALEHLGFEVAGEADTLAVTPPWWRPDIQHEADLVEEIGRSLGYDKLPAKLPALQQTNAAFDAYWPSLWRLKAILLGLGLDEVVTYSFVSRQQLDEVGLKPEEHLKLKNPMSQEQAYLRSSLAPSLLTVAGRNARTLPQFGLFEISKVFAAGQDHTKQPEEPLTLAILWRHKNGYVKVKNALDTIGREFGEFAVVPSQESLFQPRRSAQVLLEDQPIGRIGEIHPDILVRLKLEGPVGFLELRLLPWLTQPASHVYRPMSRYPSISRDLAIVLSQNVLWADIAAAIEVTDDQELAFLSDYYDKDLPSGTKSLAIRLTFSSPNRTLTDAEADAKVADVMKVLEKKFEARLRD